MSTATRTRFKTGELCVISGVYEFDGYVDGTSWPQPTQDERKIPLSAVKLFRQSDLPKRRAGGCCETHLISISGTVVGSCLANCRAAL